MKLCPYCKKEVTKKRNKFCNRSCSTSYNNIQRSKCVESANNHKMKLCPYCNKEITKKRNKFCNRSCSTSYNNIQRYLEYKQNGKTKKCNTCKLVLDITNFYKNYGKCKKCSKESIKCEHEKRKCKHGIRKEYCLDCGGSSLCEHKIKKSYCHKCGGSSLCIHCKYIRADPRYVESLDKKVKCCSGCFYKFYPNDKIPRRYKLKQHYFNDKLKEKFGNDFLQYDRKINGGCSGKIPDWFLDCYTHSIIIELDEEQHKYTSCDEKRNMELFRDLGNRPLVIIRINPDKYKIGKTKKIGCFDFDDKNNIKCLTDEFDIRFNKLVKNLQFFIDNQPIKELTIKKLFFNKKSS